VLAIIFGFGAALCWATALMTSARSARLIGSWATLAWVMLLGLGLTLPLLALSPPVSLTPAQVGLLAVSGVSNIAGLLCVYAAVRGGKVAIVAPIVSTEGALAALIAVAFGEPLAAGAAVLLTILVIGVILASTERTTEIVDRVRPRTVAFALAGAGLFGVNLYASARLGADLPLAWAILPPRVVGTVAVALPMLLTRRLAIRRDAVRYVALIALAEVLGTASFAFGARDGIAVASVMASQFGAIAAIVSVLFFGERIGRLQVAGVGIIAIGVAALSALRA
jgi:drug/metabolite transporter (DMT)-like permease